MQEKKPLIGLTVPSKLDNPDKYYLIFYYIRAIGRAGGVTILLSPTCVMPKTQLNIIDGLVLSGGGDINSKRYNQPPCKTLYEVDDLRDEFEINLFNNFFESKKPLFCICRGMQIANIALGGNLHQHIPKIYKNYIPHRVQNKPTTHKVKVNKNSKMGNLLDNQDEINTTSWHHQCINQLGSKLIVTAQSSDGVIEALEHESHPNFIAVQWHPEFNAEKDKNQQKIFDSFVQATLTNNTAIT